MYVVTSSCPQASLSNKKICFPMAGVRVLRILEFSRVILFDFKADRRRDIFCYLLPFWLQISDTPSTHTHTHTHTHTTHTQHTIHIYRYIRLYI
ncbi:hypothetical protein WDU94_004949 [Cyamophila willieti]